MPELTKDQKSLLLYLEVRIVDHRGLVDTSKMSSTDAEQAQTWYREGFIDFGRLPARLVFGGSITATHYVVFSDDAWKQAHKLRRERGERGREWLRGQLSG
jgi:hypothetical protein